MKKETSTPGNMQFFHGAPIFSARALLLIAALTSGALGINITTVEIPYLIKAGSSEPIILDCNYDLGNAPAKGLVIKWFLNRDVLYQWIFGKEPLPSDDFKKYIDVSFKASNDPQTMYRAVKLVKPSHELSGTVKCRISTHFADAEASREMLVYSPAKSIQLHHPVLNKTTNRLTVTCLAEDLYPQPKIIIHRDRKPIAIQERKFKNNTDGRFNAEAFAVMEADKVKLPTVFRCEVSIPEANYTAAQEIIYNGGHVPAFSALIIALNIIILKMY